MVAGNAAPNRDSVLIVAAGTAGHIYPSAVLAQTFLDQKVRVHWWGDPKALAALPEHPLLSKQLLKIKSPRQWSRLLSLGFYGHILSDLRALTTLLWGAPPRLTLVTGGIVGILPALLTALCGIPVFVYEQNVILGSANALVRRFCARHTFYGLPPKTLPKNASYTAQPLREQLLTLKRPMKRPPEKKVLLVMGGSLGSGSFNTTLAQALSQVPGLQCWKIIHLCGPTADIQHVTAQYQHSDLIVLPYCSDMGSLYAQSDLVIARSGALSLSELHYLQIPTITIPLPNSAGDHQRANAQIMAQHAPIVVMEQSQITAKTLEKMIGIALILHNFPQSLLIEPYRHAAQEIVEKCLK